MSPLRWGVGGAAGALSGLIWLLAVGVLHELAVDGPGSFELFKGAAELFLGLEESLFEFCVASGQLLIGEFGEHAFGLEVVGDKPGCERSRNSPGGRSRNSLLGPTGDDGRDRWVRQGVVT